MILTQLPDLLPRPETSANAAFRRHFYSHWGKENCIVAGAARRAEYSLYRQTLSIKTVRDGQEHYYLDRRRLSVSDQTYLVLNEEREYSSVLDCPQEAYSFSLFFRPGLAGEVAGARGLTIAAALDLGGDSVSRPSEFCESLRRNDNIVTPVLQYIRYYVEQGVDDQAWYDEQFNFLLERLLGNEHKLTRLAENLDCVSSSKRKELAKRLGWAVDFMHAHMDKDLTLADLARAAHLSVFHFVRMFRALYGLTPVSYLRRRRAERALTLIKSTDLGITEIAAEVGMSRLALWRNLRRTLGASPQLLRQQHKLTQSRLADLGVKQAVGRA